jgi:hypothetical protein
VGPAPGVFVDSSRDTRSSEEEEERGDAGKAWAFLC